MSTWQQELGWWMAKEGDFPAEWPGVPLNEIKATMLRTLQMPHEELDGRAYRYTVCTLERGRIPGSEDVDWERVGATYVMRACAYASADFAMERFLMAVTTALYVQRNGTIQSRDDDVVPLLCTAAGIKNPWGPPWCDENGFPVRKL